VATIRAGARGLIAGNRAAPRLGAALPMIPTGAGMVNGVGQ
jgi:hypothetical protein